MTARANTVVHVDAATVYAEGVLAGLRTACNIIGRTDDGDVPPQLQAQCASGVPTSITTSG